MCLSDNLRITCSLSVCLSFPLSSICKHALYITPRTGALLELIYLFIASLLRFCCSCAFCFVLLPLACFDNNLKLHLAFVNVYVTVFLSIGNTYISILLLCYLYLLFVEFMMYVTVFLSIGNTYISILLLRFLYLLFAELMNTMHE